MTTRIRKAVPLLLTAVFCIPARADDWPQWGGPRRDGVWREEGIAERFPPGGLPVLWRAAVGPGYSGPAVAGGRVFVMDREPADAGEEIRVKWDVRNRTEGRERVVCLEADSGRVLWSHSYPCEYFVSYGLGPRATPAVEGDRVYTLGAMGDLLCLEAATGRVVWRKNLAKDLGAEVPLYGFASSPLVDGDRLITLAGGEKRTVVAFDRHTGRESWKAVSTSEPGYCPPMIFTLGGRRQLVAFHPEGLHGLEPESGRELWSVPLPVKAGISITAPAAEGDRLAISSQYGGAALLDFKAGGEAPEVVWHIQGTTVPERTWRKSGVNTTMSTLLLRDGFVYGVSLYGETCCLKGDTGERAWTTLQPTSGGDRPRDRWSTLFMTPHRDRTFILNEKGDLILARLTPAGYEELDRTHVIDPDMPSGIGRKVLWSPPAFATRRLHVRNNREVVCASLAAPPEK